jgi:branched-chain amino acid transport system permease protein
MQGKASKILLVLMMVALLLVPALESHFLTYLAIQMMILSILAMGFNLLLGYTGLLSFGQAGFYATGAYCTGLILIRVHPSLLLGVLGGTFCAGLLAVLLGFLCVRHTQIYFAMLTLAFGMMVYSLAWQWVSVTGGDDGLMGIPRAPLAVPGIFAISMKSMHNYYYFVLSVTVAAIFVLYRIVRSPFGIVLQGIRENEIRAAFAGISVRRYRFLAFVISGLFAGLAGSLLGPLESTIGPDTAHWTMSAEPVMVTLLGGVSVFAGPIVGSVLFIALKEIIVRFTEYWLIWFGVIILVIVLGFRGGVLGFFAERGITLRQLLGFRKT